ncbi:hypothetical protein GCK32_001022 [Trichostrongylus colubriformis]|uniref:Uncharacterized protein n=1 Tax=Trichostrongylus colubriformis TaxID=6319 RepID=A0AAN8F544_TRICO
MQFRNAVLVVLVVVLVMGADGARDRSRKKNRDKQKSAETESALEDESRRGFGESEGLSEKARERNRERERERERGMGMGEKEKEEESSEEKDDDKKEKNATDSKEVVIPQARLRRSREFDAFFEYDRMRRSSDRNDGTSLIHSHKKSSELNEGKHIPLDEVQNKHHHSKQRSRRALEHGEVKELDYGNPEPLNRNHSHSKQHRMKRWPLPGKQAHHGRTHKKLRVRDKKKNTDAANHHRAMRIRRAEMAEEQKKEEEKKKHFQKHTVKDSSSSESKEENGKMQRRIRSLVTHELIPKGNPPYETQSEEALERDKTLKSLYPSQFF